MSLVMSEEQGLALTAGGSGLALGAEVICTFEGKGGLCPRLPLVRACPVLRMVVGQAEQRQR